MLEQCELSRDSEARAPLLPLLALPPALISPPALTMTSSPQQLERKACLEEQLASLHKNWEKVDGTNRMVA